MNSYIYLDKINSPSDLKALPQDKIPELCSEIRSFLIENVSKTGGHLASNLGTVELTVAIHRVFNAPEDHIIFDVGHQCYTHKLITGRRERFDSLRKIGGLSGFTKMEESEYDCFGAGHSSTSVSAAIGFAEADKINGKSAYTIAVLGDGAYTGGMIHEALNNCRRDLPLIIILNENEMSISKNTGRFAGYIAKIRSSKSYYRSKRRTVRFILHIPFIGKKLFRGIRKIKQALKNIMYASNYFEDLGLYYLGPADGNDEETVETLLREAVMYGQSAVIHLKTKKGKGYQPAERAPENYHSVSPGCMCAKDDNFSKKFGEYLVDLASRHDDICGITAAMSEATGLDVFREKYRNRFFDVGIAEEHALTFSAGLAANGMRPFFAVYSSFLQRGYDNLVHDIALQQLPVVVCIDRAGLSAFDGPTHHGIFDVAFISEIPGMALYCPSSFKSLRLAMEEAYLLDAPCAIRYSNCGECEEINRRFYPNGMESLSAAASDFSKDEKKDKIIITYGRLVNEAVKAEELLGDDAGIILLEKLKPYSETAEQISKLLPETPAKILFYEEGIKNGGAGMIIEDELKKLDIMKNKTYSVLAVDGGFKPKRNSDDVFYAYGIGASDAADMLRD